MTQIIYKKKLDLVPSVNSSIFRLAPIGANERKLLSIAKKYKLSGISRKAEIAKTYDTLVYTEKNFQVSLNKYSGAFRFVDMQKWQFDDGEADIGFKDEEVKSIATDFISFHKLAKSNELQYYKTTRLEVGSQEKATGKSETRTIDVGVVYQRVINGIPVEGPGGKIVVYIDAYKNVTGCDTLWREIRNEYRAIPSKMLKAPISFERSLNYLSRKLQLPNVTVDDMRFGYFEDGYDSRQLFMQPVYIAPYTVSSEDGKFITKSFHIYNAARKSVGRIKYPTFRVDKEPNRT